MKKHFFLAILIAIVSLISFSFVDAEKNTNLSAGKSNNLVAADSSFAKPSLAEKIYDTLHLQQTGLSKSAVEYAVKGYQKLVDSGLVKNPRYLTLVDLSQSSRNKRFYILDMKNEQLAWNTYVAHGRNSGVDMAENFSNNFNSNESSLGFYLTETTYSGKHGLSLRMNGLEKGFNDHAEARGVVVHGAPYVNASRSNSDYMGRSQGCPALPENEYAQVINIIKEGSVLFVYHPTEDYLQSSTLLN